MVGQRVLAQGKKLIAIHGKVSMMRRPAKIIVAGHWGKTLASGSGLSQLEYAGGQGQVEARVFCHGWQK